ncbi:MAG: DUF3443 domain-containing protein [Betaproteobacteria bacterium]
MKTTMDCPMRNVMAAAAMGILVLTSACGGGNDETFAAANMQPVTVGPGPANNINLLFTTVELCTHGNATECQLIDHVLVDTGSTGLRILASVLSPSLLLRQQTDTIGSPLVECGQFVNGFTWGSVKIADIRIAAELARSAPMQIIGDPDFFNVPASCSSIGPPRNTAQALGANGILGVGMFLQDCGAPCAQNAISGTYYVCPASGCRPVSVSLPRQVQNPVGMFSLDNNGIIIDLPSIADAGASSVNGSLIFGIDTRGNNVPFNAQVIRVNQNTGTFNTLLNGVNYSNSFVDSGSNALYFASSSIPGCPGNPDFDCPASTLNLSATMRSATGAGALVNFSVTNAETLFASHPTFFAFDNIAGTNSDASQFDWGLPFFFGRKVFIALEGQSTPLGVGPYVAFQ